MQRGSLVLIMEAILYASPKYAGFLPPPAERRQLRNRLLRCERDGGAYKFSRAATLFVSEHNPGAEAIAQQLRARTRGLDITDTYNVTASASHLSARHLPQMWRSPNVSCSSEPLLSGSVNAASISFLGGSRCATATPISHFLLYLNNATFADMGTDVHPLVRQVGQALRDGVQVVLVHEKRVAMGACEFEHFFHVTPQSLDRAGLFKSIATPLYDTPLHMAIAIALVAEQMGAKPVRPANRVFTLASAEPVLDIRDSPRGRTSAASAHGSAVGSTHSAPGPLASVRSEPSTLETPRSEGAESAAWELHPGSSPAHAHSDAPHHAQPANCAEESRDERAESPLRVNPRDRSD